MGFPWLTFCFLPSWFHDTAPRHFKFVKWLLRVAPPRTIDVEDWLENLWPDGYERIDEVVDVDFVKAILDHGVSPNACLKTVHDMVRIEVVAFLVNAGANIDIDDGALLRDAIWNHSMTRVKQVLEMGARVDLRSPRYFQALTFGQIPERIEDFGAKRKLLETYASRQGVTVRCLQKYKEDEASEVGQIWNVVVHGNEQDLIDTMPRIRAVIRDGLSPDEFDAMTVAIPRADTEHQPQQYRTILAFAINSGQSAIVRQLLYLGFSDYSRFDQL